jgi:filamentous hemagglutinin family protein
MARARERLARIAAAAVLACVCLAATGQPITANGLGTTASAAGSNWTIGGGTQVGGNLFHSFGRFNIDSGGSATFGGPGSVTHIVSRVTGGERSMIDGRLASSIPAANFWFINPAGVTFGASASLDVKGSFHVSSADYVQLGALQFGAATPASRLVSAPPSAFGFVSASPASIAVNGATLRVLPRHDLSIAGGDVSLTDARLRAPGGAITVRGGEVLVSGGSIDTRTRAAGVNAGDITLDASRALTIDNQAHVVSKALADGNAGVIRLVGGKITIDNLSQVHSGSSASATGNGALLSLQTSDDLVMGGFANLGSASYGEGKSGPIEVRARDFTINHGHISAATYGVTSDAGNVTIDVNNLTFGDNSSVDAGTGLGTHGMGGTIRVHAAGTIRLTDKYGMIDGSSSGAGRGGDVFVDALRVRVENGGSIGSATYGSGRGGDVHVTATESVVITGVLAKISSESYQNGRAGDIAVRAPDVQVTDAGSIIASGPRPGNVSVDGARVLVSGGGKIASGYISDAGGNVTIRATESVTVTGIVSQIVSDTYGTRDAGNISITTPLLTVSDGAKIDTNSNLSSGAAGNIVVHAADVRVDGVSWIRSSTDADGPGGSVTIDATNSVRLTGGGYVQTETSGIRDGGALSIITPVLSLDEGRISATASFYGGAPGTIDLRVGRLQISSGSSIASDNYGPATGGGVKIHAAESVSLAGTAYVSSVAFGDGNGGAVSITAPLVAMDGGRIDASSSAYFGLTNAAGGSVTIDAGRLTMANGAIVSAASETRGAAGAVRVNASESIEISGPSYLFSGTFGPGSGGTIEVGTPLLKIDFGGISSQTNADGNGGGVRIVADQMEVSGGGFVLASSFGGSGDAGPVDIFARQITLAGQDAQGFSSAVASHATGTGRGGSISITASDSLRLFDGATIATEAKSQDGGDIRITAANLLHMRKSGISTSVGTDRGNGGNITIDPVFVVLEDARIVANAFQGSGGNISIVSQFFLTQGDWLVQASSEKGISGSVAISSPRVDLSGALRVLPSNFLDASSLLRASCGARAGQSNSFLAAGRGGIAEPPLASGQLTAPARTSNIGLACGS